MTNQQLIDWVADPARSEHDLRVAAHGLGLPYAGLTRGQLVTNIVTHLGALPAGNLAAWSPPPVAPPAPPTPTPPAPPAPVAAVPVIPWGLAGLALGLAAVAAGLFFLALSLRPVPGVPAPETTQTSAPTAAPTQAPKQPTAAPAVPTQPAPPAGPTAAPAAPTVAPQPTSTPAKPAGPAPTAKWPASAEEAARLFAPDTPASRWEKNPDGGWHLREEAFTTLVNPRGFLGEGYFDTNPGKNPDCFAFTVPLGVQGATIWPEAGTRASAEALQAKKAIPKWGDGAQTRPCRVIAP